MPRHNSAGHNKIRAKREARLKRKQQSGEYKKETRRKDWSQFIEDPIIQQTRLHLDIVSSMDARKEMEEPYQADILMGRRSKHYLYD